MSKKLLLKTPRNAISHRGVFLLQSDARQSCSRSAAVALLVAATLSNGPAYAPSRVGIVVAGRPAQRSILTRAPFAALVGTGPLQEGSTANGAKALATVMSRGAGGASVVGAARNSFSGVGNNAAFFVDSPLVIRAVGCAIFITRALKRNPRVSARIRVSFVAFLTGVGSARSGHTSRRAAMVLPFTGVITFPTAQLV